MRWQGRRQSTNVDDRRRVSAGGMAMGGGGLILILLVGSCILGADPLQLLQLFEPVMQQQQVNRVDAQQEDKWKEFVSVVLADTEDVWQEQFRQMGRQYVEPKLVLFTGQVRSACGFTTAATGPFYCPPDQTMYIDLSFFEELARRHHAPGDFAQAYVIAHEVGHHVQNLLGISDQVHSIQQRAGRMRGNDLSVRLELQADFLAGVWAHHAQATKHILEVGDIEEALNAAAAIGDDRLQMEANGYVVPESFTHGTSQQRARWFRLGLQSGDLTQGDTFDKIRL